ncbi:hypothetical protein HDV64DRAFT_55375 [Trichoderma sp. TUCIM 5745]
MEATPHHYGAEIVQNRRIHGPLDTTSRENREKMSLHPKRCWQPTQFRTPNMLQSARCDFPSSSALWRLNRHASAAGAAAMASLHLHPSSILRRGMPPVDVKESSNGRYLYNHSLQHTMHRQAQPLACTPV